MRKIIFSLILLVMFTSYLMAAGVSYRDTNLTILGNGQSLYGKQSSGLYQQIIGISTANNVVIDKDKNGVIINSFLGRTKGSTALTSATTNATLTPVSAFQPIDTFRSLAISTCNTIATTNIPVGSLVYMQSVYASQNVVFVEGGNIYLASSSRTITSPYDLIVFLHSDANTWVEAGFYDNN